MPLSTAPLYHGLTKEQEGRIEWGEEGKGFGAKTHIFPFYLLPALGKEKKNFLFFLASNLSP